MPSIHYTRCNEEWMTGWLTLREMAFVEEEGFMIIEEAGMILKGKNRRMSNAFSFILRIKEKTIVNKKAHEKE